MLPFFGSGKFSKVILIGLSASNAISEKLYETKYSRVDLVNFLKAVFHKIYLVHS